MTMPKKTRAELLSAWDAEAKAIKSMRRVVQTDFAAFIEAGATKEEFLHMKKDWKNGYFESTSNLETLMNEISSFIDEKIKIGFKLKEK